MDAMYTLPNTLCIIEPLTAKRAISPEIKDEKPNAVWIVEFILSRAIRVVDASLTVQSCKWFSDNPSG